MGSFTYTGPSVAAALTVGILNNAEDIAAEKMTKTEQLSNQAIAAADVTVPDLDSLTPPVIDTSIAPATSNNSRGLILAEMRSDQLEVLDELVDLFQGFMGTYFPWEPEFDAARSWVNRALTTGGTGLNPLYERQIIERDRARLAAESARAEDEVMKQWAARRFPLPPGAAAHQILQIQQGLRDGLAASSREVMIKQMEIEVENARIALNTVVDLRKSSLSLAMDYVKGMIFSYTFPTEQVVQSAAAATEVEKAAVAYYQAQVSLKDLVARAAINTYDTQARFVEAKANIELNYVRQKVDALIAGMQSVGTQAAAALNAMHGSVGFSGNDASN